MAWKRTKVQVEAKTQHGSASETARRTSSDVARKLDVSYGQVQVKNTKKNLREEELSAHAYFEEFQEKLAAGMLQAEPLDQVISQAEAEEQDRKKPDPPRQYGIHLDAALTIQTRREELRQKHDVLSNC